MAISSTSRLLFFALPFYNEGLHTLYGGPVFKFVTFDYIMLWSQKERHLSTPAQEFSCCYACQTRFKVTPAEKSLHGLSVLSVPAHSQALPKVVLLTGTTGVGKSFLAAKLASLVDGELISGDSIKVLDPNTSLPVRCTKV
jgi:hypothetical protein